MTGVAVVRHRKATLPRPSAAHLIATEVLVAPNLVQVPPDVASGIIATIDRFTNFLVGYLSALAAVGALAMAVIEFVKKVRDSRTRFHARRVLGFIEATTNEREAKARLIGSAEGSPPAAVLAQLIQLGTGVNAQEAAAKALQLVAAKGRLPAWYAWKRDPAYAVFALELERMMGAIQEAGDVALTTPAEHTHVYLLMTSGASDEDVKDWYVDGGRVMAAAATGGANAPPPERVKRLGDQFTRLRQIMKRRLDAFQLYTADSWASMNQLWANIVGAVVMFSVLMWMRGTNDPAAPSAVVLVALSLLGGALSPIAKDLLNLLKRVKSG